MCSYLAQSVLAGGVTSSDCAYQMSRKSPGAGMKATGASSRGLCCRTGPESIRTQKSIPQPHPVLLAVLNLKCQFVK
ncbi:hypothetical protein PAXRUDRAFT_825098 [Paxillus rubicundulus Ve08.2h10]|uniref:Unplaced genomic scaffold scaffold_121, whole genome shotgun sequence n=1 Tax=Paxillus rubicundulus Ve08.2h10 TaxID=930991 RepID=A0A0D0E6V7_9AGAM|nr:hypothetical protein PAXRUDRAFT_825098 [Paxillus rubicundulus Ve08.2h10]